MFNGNHLVDGNHVVDSIEIVEDESRGNRRRQGHVSSSHLSALLLFVLYCSMYSASIMPRLAVDI